MEKRKIFKSDELKQLDLEVRRRSLSDLENESKDWSARKSAAEARAESEIRELFKKSAPPALASWLGTATFNFNVGTIRLLSKSGEKFHYGEIWLRHRAFKVDSETAAFEFVLPFAELAAEIELPPPEKDGPTAYYAALASLLDARKELLEPARKTLRELDFEKFAGDARDAVAQREIAARKNAVSDADALETVAKADPMSWVPVRYVPDGRLFVAGDACELAGAPAGFPKKELPGIQYVRACRIRNRDGGFANDSARKVSESAARENK